MKRQKADEIRQLMQIRYDLDQLELSKLNYEIKILEDKIASSTAASIRIEHSAFQNQLGFSSAGSQLVAQTALRRQLAIKKQDLMRAQNKQRKRSSISFAKNEVAKKL